ncbi:MAG: PIN domain-containing protein [Nostocales cyanobacterium 94392]|nr:PIN domain-containing protein [Nostocales cyanobacterium 94392]
MTAVVADTHTIIWYIVEPQRLSTNASLRLDQASNTGQSIYRLLSVCDTSNASIVSVSLNRTIAEVLRQINRDTVPDMPDRIIAATALYLNLPLVTRDAKIQALAEIDTIW